MTKIKFCGLKRIEDIKYANDLKPDFIGFVFAPKSKRFVDADTAKELKNLFPNESQCVDFVRRNYGKTAEFVAYAYKDEPRIINPSDSDNSIPVIAILFRYFVEPFIKGEKEKNSARTGFYRYFKIK